MKEFLAFWIVLQLFFIGTAVADTHNKIADNTLECPHPKTHINGWALAFVPLTVFVPENKEWREYCDKKLGENNADRPFVQYVSQTD